MHRYFLQHALLLAQHRKGFCAPNPSVGAVLVKQGEIIGQGYHVGAGHAHAEVNAINSAGDNARGAILYITLEPCTHYGRTPPCTNAIIAAGISQVYYGYRDPNPLVSGKSTALLQAAGITSQLIFDQDIQTFYKSYAYWQRKKLPWVTLKLAMSMDGKIAAQQGSPLAITGPDLKIFTHKARKCADGILTTLKTIMKDDPQLNVRLNGNILPKPLYVLDKNLELPAQARVFRTCEHITLFYDKNIVNPPQLAALQQRKVECIPISLEDDGHLNLPEVLAQIGQQGIQDLWVEAGGQCFASFINQGLAHKAYLYIAPTWLGPQTQSAFANPLQLLQGNPKVEWRAIGQDGLCEITWL